MSLNQRPAPTTQLYHKLLSDQVYWKRLWLLWALDHPSQSQSLRYMERHQKTGKTSHFVWSYRGSAKFSVWTSKKVILLANLSEKMDVFGQSDFYAENLLKLVRSLARGVSNFLRTIFPFFIWHPDQSYRFIFLTFTRSQGASWISVFKTDGGKMNSQPG